MLSIKYMFYFFKLCGVATMKFNTNLTEKGRVQGSWFASSGKGIVYNIILICFIIVFNCFGVRTVYYWSNIQFERIIDVVLYSYTTVVAVLILLAYCFRQKQAIAIANKLQILREFTMSINGQSNNESQFVVSSLKRIFIAQLVIWFVLIMSTSTEIYMLVYCAATYPCVLIINCTFLQYSVVLRYLNQLYITLNAGFINVPKEFPVSRKDFTLNTSVVRMNSLSEIRELYLSLCNLSMDVSEFYQLLMLFCVSYLFVTLLLWSYYIVAPIFVQVTELHDNKYIIYAYVRGSTIVIHHAFMLVILTQCVSAVTREVKLLSK